MAGLLGGTLGYGVLRYLARDPARPGVCDGSAYRGRSKLETLFGPDIWASIRDKRVIDFGCGIGKDAIEIAQHGARLVIGIDIRADFIGAARRAAAALGLSDRCQFTAEATSPADLVLSVDGFEHFADPLQILSTMRQLIRPEGMVLISFGPPWFHPYGGHLFSVFPWAHLLFTEKALLRWRAEFASDGATRFSEVEGGLNQMTVRRFQALLARVDFDVRHFELVPIRRLRWLANSWTREWSTSVVRCTLTPRTRRR